MTTAEVLGAAACVGVVALAVALFVGRARVMRTNERVHRLEREVFELRAAVEHTRADVQTAEATARRAAAAAGVEEPPARVAFEPIAGPVLRAVAIGAGARRALSRLARPASRRRTP